MPKLSTKGLIFEMPERKYSSGSRKMVSQRWPADLITELDKLSEAWGWNTTEVAIPALDQFVQWAKAHKKDTPGNR